MATFLLRKRLTKNECEDVANQVINWFKEHPRRRICRTQYHKVRRKHELEDILEQEKPTE